MATKYDIEIDQGSTFNLPVQIFQEDGNFLDLTDYSVAGSIRHNYDDASPSASFTTQITTPTQGKLTAQLGKTITAGLTAGNYYYDLEIVSASVTLRIVEGKAKVSPEVTK